MKGITYLYIASFVLLVAVVIGGFVMAAKGASADTFMGLVLLAVGALVLAMAVYYQKNPTYTDATGEHPVSSFTIIVLYVFGIAMIPAGIYVLMYGFT